MLVSLNIIMFGNDFINDKTLEPFRIYLCFMLTSCYMESHFVRNSYIIKLKLSSLILFNIQDL
jgi:hypothetical protein